MTTELVGMTIGGLVVACRSVAEYRYGLIGWLERIQRDVTALRFVGAESRAAQTRIDGMVRAAARRSDGPSGDRGPSGVRSGDGASTTRPGGWNR